ncbi:hypothetical protein L207DRAFT_564297 [Hyaloscypha variabilis F]|uniref:MARVEL domain-containing protein n=1 Tax=Hyaloscypha variabilis (strain UAMH 11265 / GT02V1 / F) TaxID=1149755 RepID=A0A2J6RYS2_HYAVF|nr:hypothetical protein L207DRAFT_564297 [Hyaloscypha variabilis F]
MIVTLIARVAQLLFAAVILALSVVMINGYGPGHAPSLLDYGAFCGAAGLIFAVAGIGAIFIEALQGIIILALDGIACFFLLAGAAAFAAEVKTGDCTDVYYLAGSIWKVIQVSQYKNYNDDVNAATNDIISRCRMAQADTAFLWILFIFYLLTVGLTFMSRSSKRGGALV